MRIFYATLFRLSFVIFHLSWINRECCYFIGASVPG